jgi:hypothetical protein
MAAVATPSSSPAQLSPPTTWRSADAMSLAGFASLGAGAIHAVAVGVHSSSDQAMFTFMAVAVLQLAWGAFAVARANRAVAVAGVVVNLSIIAGWVLAKRSGISFIDGLEAKHGIELGDGMAAGLALLAVLAAGATLVRRQPQPGRRAPTATLAAAVTVLLLALPGMSAAARPAHQHGTGAADHEHTEEPVEGAEPVAVVAPVPYDPRQPIDLGGVEGVTPEQQARAENLIATTLSHLPQYADPAAAEAAGFRSIRDGSTGYEHYINSDFRADGRVLDPDHPESLVYEVRGGVKTLVAAMYMAEPGTTLETTPELGGALTQWHIHDNLCFSPEGQVAGITTSDGGCPPPQVKFDPVPMIHVWIVPHPCGPFAALDGISGGSIKPGEQRLCDSAHGH